MDSSPALSLPVRFVSGRIGVVTVLFNSETVLPEFFTSIESQSYTNFTVFAVDNASTDRSVAMCRERGATYQVIANESNLGVAAGNNQGIRAAIESGCKYILLLNNDVVFGPELFAELVAGLSTHQCEMTTPLVYFHTPNNRIWYAGGGFQWWAGNRQSHCGQGEIDKGQFARPHPVEYAPTCCVLIRREVFARVGLMDEAYFVYWDDTDFMLRTKRAGVRFFFLPQAKLWHKVSSLTGGKASNFTISYATRNHAYYFRKHLPLLATMLFSALYYSVYTLQYLTGIGGRDRALLRIRSWQKGLKLGAAELAKH
jgi:GT2 family glycosyltransferase